MREHDEPFLVEGPGEQALLEAIESLGKRWSRGGRFYHIHDAIDKGQAARLVIEHLASPGAWLTTAALGDAPNDIPLLEACDHQFIIGARYATAMLAALPEATVIPQDGPAGWNQAVLNLLLSQ